MGGRGSNEVFLFDTKTKKQKKVAEGGPETEYMNVQNSVVLAQDNRVIALTFNGQNEPCLIEYKKGDSEITLLRKYGNDSV